MDLAKAILRYLVVVACISLVVLSLLVMPVSACIDPSSAYAVEVVLNKPGVRYNLSLLEHLASGAVTKVSNTTYVFKYVARYERHYAYPSKTVVEKREFLVILYEAKFSNGAPYVEWISTSNNVEYYLGIRVELVVPPGAEVYIPKSEGIVVKTVTTTIALENSSRVLVTVIPQITTATTSPSEEAQQSNRIAVYPTEFKNALKKVLSYLTCETGVVLGLSCDDIEKIVELAEPGLAGWNNRLIYSSALGTWAPYSELVTKGIIKGALLKGNACAVRIPTSIATTEALKPLLNTTIIVVYPGPTPPIPTPMPTPPQQTATPISVREYLVALSSAEATSTPIYTQTPAYLERAFEKPYDGTLTVVSIAVGILVAVLVYMYLAKRMLS
jgi:hypothetical protein